MRRPTGCAHAKGISDRMETGAKSAARRLIGRDLEVRLGHRRPLQLRKLPRVYVAPAAQIGALWIEHRKHGGRWLQTVASASTDQVNQRLTAKPRQPGLDQPLIAKSTPPFKTSLVRRRTSLTKKPGA